MSISIFDESIPASSTSSETIEEKVRRLAKVRVSLFTNGSVNLAKAQRPHRDGIAMSSSLSITSGFSTKNFPWFFSMMKTILLAVPKVPVICNVVVPTDKIS